MLLCVGKYLVTRSFVEEIYTPPLQSFLWLSNFKKKNKRDTRLHFSINPQMVLMVVPRRKDMNRDLHKSNPLRHTWEASHASACPHTAVHASQLLLTAGTVSHAQSLLHTWELSWINLFRTQKPSWGGYYCHRYLTDEETEAQWHCRTCPRACPKEMTEPEEVTWYGSSACS